MVEIESAHDLVMAILKHGSYPDCTHRELWIEQRDKAQREAGRQEVRDRIVAHPEPYDSYGCGMAQGHAGLCSPTHAPRCGVCGELAGHHNHPEPPASISMVEQVKQHQAKHLYADDRDLAFAEKIDELTAATVRDFSALTTEIEVLKAASARDLATWRRLSAEVNQLRGDVHGRIDRDRERLNALEARLDAPTPETGAGQ